MDTFLEYIGKNTEFTLRLDHQHNFHILVDFYLFNIFFKHKKDNIFNMKEMSSEKYLLHIEWEYTHIEIIGMRRGRDCHEGTRPIQ